MAKIAMQETKAPIKKPRTIIPKEVVNATRVKARTNASFSLIELSAPSSSTQVALLERARELLEEGRDHRAVLERAKDDAQHLNRELLQVLGKFIRAGGTVGLTDG